MNKDMKDIKVLLHALVFVVYTFGFISGMFAGFMAWA
jgi:hypothetical protein